MAAHEAPSGWLTRWQEAEPVRLYLWGVSAAVLSAAVVAGWLTQELYVALTGVAAAVLTIGGTAAARRHAYAPLTVHQLVNRHRAEAFEEGATGALLSAERSRRGWELEEEQPATRLVAASQRRDTVQMAAVKPCPFMDEDGHRCTLARHPRTTEHVLET